MGDLLLTLAKLSSLGLQRQNCSVHICDLRLLHKYIPHLNLLLYRSGTAFRSLSLSPCSVLWD